MQCFRNVRALRDERGSTFIELLAASVILGVLVLGLSTLWTTVGGLSFNQLLRQKAVFALNGELERLDALYTKTSFGAGTRLTTTGYPTVSNISGSDTRLVYDSSSIGASFVATSLTSFQASNSAVWENGLLLSARNYVWLDQPRGIVARLSWIEQPLSLCGLAGGGKNSPCTCYPFSGIALLAGSCIQVVLLLEYPFTIQNGAPVVMANQSLKTMTLRTIEGRRA